MIDRAGTPQRRRDAEALRNTHVIIPQRAHLIGRGMARKGFAACIAAANDSDKGSEGDDRMDVNRT